MELELDFIDGQAHVPLRNGLALSVLTPARDVILREARKWRFPGQSFPMTRATHRSVVGPGQEPDYEVALVDPKTRGCAGPIDGWEQWDNNDDDGWITYGYVPASVVREYLVVNGAAS